MLKTSPNESSLNGSQQQFFGVEHERITLEALESTKMAAAQFAAIALSKGADENVVKELSVLQSTLFTLQHQQVFQLQLIQKLQSQLETKSRQQTSDDSKSEKLSSSSTRSPSPSFVSSAKKKCTDESVSEATGGDQEGNIVSNG